MKSIKIHLTIICASFTLHVDESRAQLSDQCETNIDGANFPTQGPTQGPKRRQPSERSTANDKPEKASELSSSCRQSGKLPSLEEMIPISLPNQQQVAKKLGATIPKPEIADYENLETFQDRWRVVEAIGYENQFVNPYNRNPIKGDRPIWRNDWFFSGTIISDTVWEKRRVATANPDTSAAFPGSTDQFSDSNQLLFNQVVTAELVWLKGDTVFRPPDWEFRVTPAFNLNYTEFDTKGNVGTDSNFGRTRTDEHIGWQALFADYHIRNVSDRFDFDSIRLGIQPFSSDFRGFVFQDQQFGLRLFGTRNNNFWQYNLAWFRRLEKDTNSGLNDLSQPLREDDVFAFNVYRQDWPVLGYVSQGGLRQL